MLKNTKIATIYFMDSEELTKIRHSLAHLLAMAALEKDPDVKLAIGPTIDNGFYYDLEFSSGITISEKDLSSFEKRMKKFIKDELSFEGREVTADEARKIFKDQPYKLELIDELEKSGEKITIYTSGDFTDLCRGGHVENTREIPADGFSITHTAGAYWRGNEKNKMLTRIYGLAFESKEELDKYVVTQEEAKKRDHKKIGRELGLFMFHETAPGMPYWLPKGLMMYKELENYWRVEHEKFGYREISSPLVNKAELWKTSGHWEHYKDDMFIADMGENEVYGIKPMNCPNAMIVFQSMQVSYKDLPIRLSDTDRLHRYERSGTLNGLLRCRSFQQDDSHNYVTEDMIESEYESIMNICHDFYGIFNLEYSFRFGTRPESYLGTIETWNKAEDALKRVLQKSGKKFSVEEGDGAFYGPKIDIIMKDALGRDWQMGTMQLDFQLPERFGLKYTDRDGKKKMPVVIHRVIYGSLERFLGILIEHTAGAFPTWIAPVQTVILPIGEKHREYATTVYKSLRDAGIRAELNDSDESLGKKIRSAKTSKVPYFLVIGDKEVESKTITVESRDKGQIGTQTPDQFIFNLKEEIARKK